MDQMECKLQLLGQEVNSKRLDQAGILGPYSLKYSIFILKSALKAKPNLAKSRANYQDTNQHPEPSATFAAAAQRCATITNNKSPKYRKQLYTRNLITSPEVIFSAQLTACLKLRANSILWIGRPSRLNLMCYQVMEPITWIPNGHRSTSSSFWRPGLPYLIAMTALRQAVTDRRLAISLLVARPTF